MVEILRSTDDENCPHEQVALLLDELQRLHKDVPIISPAHIYFQRATVAFADMVTNSRADDFYDAVQKLKEFAKHHNQHYKYLYDEIQRLQRDIALHQQIIVCLEYRHVLESLPQKDIIESWGDAKDDHTSQWKSTWEKAARIQLTAMLEVLIDRKTVEAGTPMLVGPRRPLSAPLTELFQFDFDYWVRKHQKALKAMVTSQQADLATMEYSEFRSYQRGYHLYGELSTNIHDYGKSYVLDDGTWLKGDKIVLEWLQPEVSSGGEVDWKAEWAKRHLPS